MQRRVEIGNGRGQTTTALPLTRPAAIRMPERRGEVIIRTPVLPLRPRERLQSLERLASEHAPHCWVVWAHRVRAQRIHSVSSSSRPRSPRQGQPSRLLPWMKSAQPLAWTG